MDDPRGQAARFQIRHLYHFVRPEAFHTILTPPPGFTAAYFKVMDMRLRFPLTPFVKDLLNAYNLSLWSNFAQLLGRHRGEADRDLVTPYI